MGKLKTHKGTDKRVKVTRKKLTRAKAGKIHFNEKKRPGRKRSLAVKAIIKGAIAKRLRRALGK